MSATMNETAKAAANFVHDNMFEAHRGAIWWTDNLVAIFGNDGYQRTAWVKKEVAILRQLVEAQGMKECGFAVADGGYSWVQLVHAPTPECQSSTGELFRQQLWSMHHNDLIWQAWREAVGASLFSPRLDLFEGVQRTIADAAITAKKQPITGNKHPK